MPQSSNHEVKKPGAKRHVRGPAAMKAANSKSRRAGHGRHAGDRPKAAGQSDIVYTAADQSKSGAGTKQGRPSDAHVKKYDVDKAPGAAQQATVMTFAFGYNTKHGGSGGKEHPTADAGVNKPINFGGLGAFDPSRMRMHSNMTLGRGGMHAT